MGSLLLLLVIDGAIAGTMAWAVIWLLGRFGIRPRFVAIFIWCVIALALLSGCVATLLPALKNYSSPH
jgi:hypothetical protein